MEVKDQPKLLVTSSETEKDGQSATPPEQGWERQMELPSKTTAKSVKLLLLTSALLLFPALYLGLAIAAIALQNKPVTPRQSSVIDFDGSDEPPAYSVQGLLGNIRQLYGYFTMSQVIKVAVTLWPILFTVAVARSLKNFAHWSSERGVKLITLEQVVASKSFGSAVLAPITFKTVNVTATFLILLWAFSPIATQALQRFFMIGVVAVDYESPQIMFIDMTNPLQQANAEVGFVGSPPASLGSIFVVGLTSYTGVEQYSAQDIFGNPRVPNLDWVSLYGSASGDGWYTIPKATASAPPVWSSVLGFPLAGIQPNTSDYEVTTNLIVETDYFSMNCDDWGTISRADLITMANQTDALISTIVTSLPANLLVTGRGGDFQDYLPGINPGSLLLSYTPGDGSSSNDTILYASIKGNVSDNNYAYTTCQLAFTQVDSNIVCGGTECSVAQIRPSASAPVQAPLISNGSILNLLETLVYSTLTDNLVDGNLDSPTSQTVAEKWLFDPTTASSDPFCPQTNCSDPSACNDATYLVCPDISEIAVDLFEQRFSALFNSLFQASYSPTNFFAGLPITFPSDSVFQPLLSNVSATEQHSQLVYLCNWAWLAVLILCAAVVAFVILLGSFLQTQVFGPDLIGYVSTLTRDNNYTPLPNGGNLLDGMERTLVLRNLRVRWQDVRPDSQVGHFALSSGEGRPLQQGRTYN